MKIRLYEDGDIEIDDEIMEDECDLLPKGDHHTYTIPDGCGNGTCIIRKPKGQFTNGPCTCFNGLKNKGFILQIKQHLNEIGWDRNW